MLKQTSFPKVAFKSHHLLNFVVAPNVHSVNDSAFNNCYFLQRFISNSLELIGAESFYCCNALAQIDLRKATNISKKAFDSCYGLVNVDIPLIEQLDHCFKGCLLLSQIKGEKLQKIDEF